jgi:hypothetical protein
MKKLFVSLLFVPAMAQAEFINGNDLLNGLQSQETVERVFVMGYIAGIADANNSITYCPPPGIQLGQLRDMAKQYLIANASIRNLSGDVLIGDMLNRRWPCKTQPSGRGT